MTTASDLTEGGKEGRTDGRTDRGREGGREGRKKEACICSAPTARYALCTNIIYNEEKQKWDIEQLSERVD